MPDWNSVESTARWSDFLFWAGIVCLILLAATEVASHIYSKRSSDLATILASTSAVSQQQEARAEQERQNAVAAQMRLQLSEAQKAAAEAIAQTAETKKQIMADHGVKARIRSLFLTIDPRIAHEIDAGKTELLVRMQPADITALKSLIAEPDGNELVTIAEFGQRYSFSTINNGTLGPSGAVEEQQLVRLHIGHSLRGLSQKHPL